MTPFDAKKHPLLPVHHTVEGRQTNLTAGGPSPFMVLGGPLFLRDCPRSSMASSPEQPDSLCPPYS